MRPSLVSGGAVAAGRGLSWQQLLLLALGCMILPTNTLLSDLSLRCVPLLEQLLQGVVSLGGSFFWRQL